MNLASDGYWELKHSTIEQCKSKIKIDEETQKKLATFFDNLPDEVKENFNKMSFKQIESLVKGKDVKETLNEIIIENSKPKEKFTEAEKQVLDQFIMKGGKTLWLVDGTTAEMENLYNESGSTLVSNNDLNLTDMFFKYGFRINPQMIKDEYGTPIKLASGKEGSESQLETYNWKMAPFIYPASIKHPIVKNTDGVKFDFCSPIELLKSNVTTTVSGALTPSRVVYG